ncbi:alpha/beta fold hydrolase [Burkholderia multivorans]|uniref:alpha/beta hydrolase n=1 Tax=Burkholderia multivorans TaxID=87883 RepID=UPI0001FD8DBF|nr:alpha/beta fold hydrolase [Burkholderia multivorans]EGD05534.1 secretory lipase [Burkholderia sp. TJI49]AOJ96332.1 signal peptide-containing protein [Burkholderia multivorans]MCA8247410.1 alpha/beta fold hydrolase [Burkholderia multivorans]MCO1340997.1 alpha/beta fold hydrolase [Burkholderia multivorans]MCO1439827.1 alpha/beta fold hydrolase [Burkholderia multivorans]
MTLFPLRGNVARTLLVSALAASSFASLAAPAARVPAPDPLQGDGRVSAFYTWDRDIPATPGTLLRSEPLPATLGLASAARQLRILYSSTDGVGGRTPIAVSGALFVPHGTPPAGGWPIVAWAHGTFGMADICAPSWFGRSYRDVRYLNAWLQQGFAVVATDYQGLGTPGPNPQLNNRSNSYTLLDSVRAVLRGVPDLANEIVLVGQSQGGSAVFAAAGYARDYAPELAVRATVATGTIYNASRDTLASLPKFDTAYRRDPERVDPTLAYQFYSVLSAQQIDPALRADEVLTGHALPLLEQARIACLASLEDDAALARLTHANTVKPGGEARLQAWWDAYLKYPTLKIDTPVFIGAGADDGLAPLELALASDACAAGTTVEAHLYAGRDHNGTVNASLADSIPFVKRVLAGEKIRPVCTPAPQPPSASQ